MYLIQKSKEHHHLLWKTVVMALTLILFLEEISCQRKKSGSNSTVRKGGLQLGAGNKRNSTIAVSFDKKVPVTSSTILEEDDVKKPEVIHTPSVVNIGGSGSGGGSTFVRGGEKVKLNLGLLVPYSMFQQREYHRAVTSAISMLQKKDAGREFYQRYKFTSDEVKMFMISVSPSPRGELNFEEVLNLEGMYLKWRKFMVQF